MAAVPGVTGVECTLTVGSTDYTMWITSASTSADTGVTKTLTWGNNAMVHSASGDYSTDIAGLFNPEGGLNVAMETAAAARTPVTLTVEYGAFSRTFTDYLVRSYADEAPADGPVTFTATLIGPDIWESVPATTP
jgi:hypothetical protein